LDRESVFQRFILGVFFALTGYLAYLHAGELWRSSGWPFRVALLIFPFLLVGVFLEIVFRRVDVDGNRIRYRSLFGSQSNFDLSEVSEAISSPDGRLKLMLRSGKWLVFYSNEKTTREIARKLNIKAGQSKYHF
jgi:hypothetical protein